MATQTHTPTRQNENRNVGQFGDHRSREEQNLGERAKNAAANVAERAKEAGAGMMDTAKDALSTASRMVGNATSTVGEKADDATSAVGRGMESLGGTIREKGPHSGVLGSASSAVAGTLETSGRYLEERGLSGIGQDLTNLIRRNPIAALLIGVGIGFLAARAFTSRSQ